MRKRPTMKEVAEMAGVSISTVSRAINGSTTISRPARRAIEEAVAKTGFRPNAIGRRLKTARTRTIGVLVPSLRNPVFADAVEGIERQAEVAGYSVLLTCSNYQRDREVAALEALLSNRVEGVLLTVTQERDSRALKFLKKERVPHVLLFNPGLHEGSSTVSINDFAAAQSVARELVGLGHRRIAMIAGEFRASDRSQLRREGFEAQLNESGVEPIPVVEVDFEAQDVGPECAELLGADKAPTAIFCSTDMLAIATIRALHNLGYRVPEDVSVIGFDGIPVGTWITPSLTSVVQPADEMGATAVRHLLERVEGQVAPLHITLPFELRTGGSTGSAPRYRDESFQERRSAKRLAAEGRPTGRIE